MKLKKTVKAVLLDKDLTTKDLANMMTSSGYRQSPQTLYNTFASGNITLDKLTRITDLLDCDIVLQDRKTGKIYK